MRLLLDTHVWLWLITGSSRLSAQARDAIEVHSNDVFLAAASAWEIAIKYRLGKLPLPLPPSEYVATMLARSEVLPLPVSVPHAAAVAALPDVPRDPFDRLLVAQALHESLAIVTADPIFGRYPVARIDA